MFFQIRDLFPSNKQRGDDSSPENRCLDDAWVLPLSPFSRATGVLGFGKISQQLEKQRKKGWINWIFCVNGWIDKVILRRLTIFVRLRPL